MEVCKTCKTLNEILHSHTYGDVYKYTIHACKLVDLLKNCFRKVYHVYTLTGFRVLF